MGEIKNGFQSSSHRVIYVSGPGFGHNITTGIKCYTLSLNLSWLMRNELLIYFLQNKKYSFFNVSRCATTILYLINYTL